MKVRMEDLKEKEVMHTLDALYTATSAMTGREAVKMFLRDLLTKSERIMLGRRILIARRILEGDTYDDITTSMKVGADTIARIEKWLQNKESGYERAIAGMRKEFAHRTEKRLYATSMLYRLKKKYPLHFLLFPTPKLKTGKVSVKNKKG